MFERALTLDPGNIEALVWRAYVDALKASLYAADDRAARLAAAEAALTTALSLAPEHAFAHLFLGLRSNPDQSRGPRHSRMRTGVGAGPKSGARSCNDRVGEVSHRSQRGNRGAYPGGTPSQPARYVRLRRGCRSRATAKLFLGSDEEAVTRFRGALSLNRNNPYTNFLLAAALAHLGRLDEAQAAVQAGLALNPQFTLRRYRAGAASDNPTFWRSASASSTACARRACRRDERHLLPERGPPGPHLRRRRDRMNGPGGPRSGKTLTSTSGTRSGPRARRA